MNEDITLYHLDTGSDKQDIHLMFEGDELVLDGYDRGPVTKELTGDYDYEYQIKVAAPQLPLLCSRFGLQTGQRQALLECVATEIAGPQAFTLFHKMLKDADIAYKIWTA